MLSLGEVGECIGEGGVMGDIGVGIWECWKG